MHDKGRIYMEVQLIVRSLSGKNWQDRDKADKVSILFPRDSSWQLKCFWGCNEEVQKFITPGGGWKKYFFERGCERLFMSYLIIVFNNNNVFGFFLKLHGPIGHIKFSVWCFQIKYYWLAIIGLQFGSNNGGLVIAPGILYRAHRSQHEDKPAQLQ